MSRKLLRMLRVTLLILFAAAFTMSIAIRGQITEEREAFERIAPPAIPTVELSVTDVSSDFTPRPTEATVPAAPIQENAGRFAELIGENSDFFGWLRIDGTKINYPVMQSEEPDFYLHHDFFKNESVSGTPYIGKSCTAESDNIIIYAHNMKNGTMFTDLLRYADESFYQKHPTICFDTVQESAEYSIVAAFREKVHTQDETDVFRYYNYVGALSESEYGDYIERIKAASIYDTGCTAVYGQKLITLSTCAYHTQNGRFVVVAVKQPA